MKVLIVEDDTSLRKSLVQIFASEDIPVVEAGSYIVAKDIILANFDGVVLTDIRMDGKDGFDVLALCQQLDPDLPVIIMTGHAEIPLAVRALKAGACDFLEKPCHPDILISAVRMAAERRSLMMKNHHLEEKIRERDPATRDFPGPSSVISKFRNDLRRLSALPVHLHIWGEEGVGKRLAARCVQALRAPLQQSETVDLRHVYTEELLTMSQTGELNQLTLHNVKAGSPEVHRGLLNVLDKNPKAQIVTTGTNPIAQMLDQPLPKELYHRFSFVELEVPPLRHRPEDVLAVFRSLLQEQSAALNIDIPNISNALLVQTSARNWVGNLVELRQWAQQVLLNMHRPDQTHVEQSLSRRMDAFEKSVLLDSLVRHKGVTAKVADELGLPLKTLYDRLGRHNLKSSTYRNT